MPYIYARCLFSINSYNLGVFNLYRVQLSGNRKPQFAYNAVGAFLLFLILWGGSVWQAEAQTSETQAVLLEAQAGRVVLDAQFSYLRDEESSLTIDQVTKPDVEALFVKGTRDFPSFGYTSDDYWYRISLENESEWSTWLLEIWPPHTDLFEVWVVTADGEMQHQQVSSLRPFGERPFFHRNFVLEIDIPQGEETVLYIHQENIGETALKATLWQSADFVQAEQIKLPIIILFVGGLLVIALHNLILGFAVQEAVYWLFGLYLILLGMLTVTYFGLGFQFLWPNNPAFQNVATFVFMLSAGGIGPLFFNSYLRVRFYSETLYKLNWITAICILLCLPTAIPIIILTNSATARFATLMIISLLGVITLINGVWTWWKGEPAARSFLIVFSGWTITVTLVAFSHSNLIEYYDPLIFELMQYILTLMAVIFLSTTLSKRYQQLKEEKARFQAEALTAAQENEQLVLHQNERLTEEVARQTAVLHQNEQTISSLLHNMDGMSFYCDLADEWLLTFASEGCEKLLGATENWLQGIPFASLFHPDDQTAVRQVIDQSVIGETDFDFTHRLLHTTADTPTWVWCYGQLHVDEASAKSRLQGLLLNVTIQKEGELQQTQMATLLERERIGRDLHDDLGQVMGYLNVQAQVTKELIEQNKLAQAEDSLSQIASLADEGYSDIRRYILDIRQEKNGSTILNSAENKIKAEASADFMTVLETYIHKLKEQYRFNVNLISHKPLAPQLLSAEAEIQALRIIQEALSNSRKYSGQQEATISIFVDDLNLHITVADNGVGFDAKTFFKNPAELKSDIGHFGLGIMQERAAIVGGSVNIQSTVGRGTQVQIEIPCKTAVDINQQQTNIRILLVDDHPLFLKGLQTLLTVRGFQVVGTAQNGEQAQEKAQDLLPDLILMDVYMPVCNGLIALQKIKQAHPDMPIIMLTIEQQDETLARAIEAGAAGYLLKNVPVQQFYKAMLDIVQGEPRFPSELSSQLIKALAKERLAPHLQQQVPRSAFSSKQLALLQELALGGTYKEIGQKLNLKERTIQYHMRNIMDILNIETRSGVAEYARDMLRQTERS